VSKLSDIVADTGDPGSQTVWEPQLKWWWKLVKNRLKLKPLFI